VRGTAETFDLFRQTPPSHSAVRSQGFGDRQGVGRGRLVKGPQVPKGLCPVFRKGAAVKAGDLEIWCVDHRLLFLAWPGPRGKCRARLEAEGFRVYLPRKVSPGDGGLSYGQVGGGGGCNAAEEDVLLTSHPSRAWVKCLWKSDEKSKGKRDIVTSEADKDAGWIWPYPFTLS